MRTNTDVLKQITDQVSGISRERNYFVFFSANTGNTFYDEYELVTRDLPGYQISQVESCHRGEKGISYVAILTRPFTIGPVMDVACKNNQESVLVVDTLNNAWVHFLGVGPVGRVGRLHIVSPEGAATLEGWSKIDDFYFSI